MVLTASLAFADLAPTPGYVETCTPDRCEGRESASCSASFQGRAECEALEQKGFVQVCRTNGASVWSEVFCKGAASGTADPVNPPAVSRCDTAAAGVGGLGVMVLLAAALIRRK